MFLGSKYIDPPYKVECVGTTVRINGRVVEEIRPPVIRPAEKGPVQNVGIRKGIGRMSKLEDLMRKDSDGREAPMYRKWDYLKQTYTRQVAVKKMLAYLRQHVCITEATEERTPEPNGLVVRVKFAMGREYFVPFDDEKPGPQEMDGERNIPEELGRLRVHMEGLLRDGDCLFFDDGGLQRHIGGPTLGRRLKAAVAVLRSSASVQEKAKRLAATGIFMPGVNIAHDCLLAKPFEASAGLERRIEAIMLSSHGGRPTRAGAISRPTTGPTR